MENENRGGTREQLIQAGLQELNEYGIQSFSTRRVAKRCGVSCATPYKHFKDTQEFIAAILDDINRQYNERQKKTLEKYAHCDSRTQLLQVSLDYLRFLTEYPELRRVIMQNFKDCDPAFRSLRGQLSYQLYKVVARYCRDVNMPDDVRKRKTFLVRSILYGAALFFDNGEMEYNQENMDMVAAMLDREFDLP
jgi:AcrR family transcriptional regulator